MLHSFSSGPTKSLARLKRQSLGIQLAGGCRSFDVKWALSYITYQWALSHVILHGWLKWRMPNMGAGYHCRTCQEFSKQAGQSLSWYWISSIMTNVCQKASKSIIITSLLIHKSDVLAVMGICYNAIENIYYALCNRNLLYISDQGWNTNLKSVCFYSADCNEFWIASHVYI